MKVINNIIGMMLVFLIFSLFFLKSELRTPQLSFLIFACIIGLLVNTFFIKRNDAKL